MQVAGEEGHMLTTNSKVRRENVQFVFGNVQLVDYLRNLTMLSDSDLIKILHTMFIVAMFFCFFF